MGREGAGLRERTSPPLDRGVLACTYPHHGQEPVQEVHRQHERLGAVAEEAGQAPQVLHFGVPALGGDAAVVLGHTKKKNGVRGLALA